MDEPLGALDKQLREQMQYEIKHLHERLGVTVVYVTHDQSEALTMSNRIAVMHHGAIQQVATPQDLYERPDNAFVAQFIGESNRIQGTVREVNGQTCVVAVEGGEVRALAVKIAGVGSASTLSLRPERVLIDPSPERCPNIFEARVEELIYHGDHTAPGARLRLRRLRHQSAELGRARAPRGRRERPGRLADRGLPGARRFLRKRARRAHDRAALASTTLLPRIVDLATLGARKDIGDAGESRQRRTS